MARCDRRGETHVHFESYIIHEDETGREFADALIAKAQEGVRVRLIYDWMGGFGKDFAAFLESDCAPAGSRCVVTIRRVLIVRSAGSREIIAKCSPLMARVGFITGLCVGRMWVGEPEKNIDPWRDTGVEVRGPAVRTLSGHSRKSGQ